ncbi:MAG: LysM domain-containing protein [Chloroflexota bacterium]
MERRDVGNEVIVALAVIGMLALALTFGVVLTLSRSTPQANATTAAALLPTSVATTNPTRVSPTVKATSPATVASTVATQAATVPPSATMAATAAATIATAEPTIAGSPTTATTVVVTAAVTTASADIATAAVTEGANTASTSRFPATDTVTQAVTMAATETAIVEVATTSAPQTLQTTVEAATATATATATIKPATLTPTASKTATKIPTATNTATATDTPIPPTPTDTPLPTETPTPTDTDTPEPTVTPLPTETETPTPSDTPTSTATSTNTSTPSLVPPTIGTLDNGILPTNTPVGSASIATATPGVCTPQVGWVPYVVQQGDTLFSIARQVGLSVSALQAADCIANPAAIIVGQVIYVPPGSLILTNTPTGTLTTSNTGNAGLCPNPDVRITSPISGSRVPGIANFFGSARGTDYKGYELEFLPEGNADWVRIASSTFSINDSLLGRLDPNPTQLGPGRYSIRLTTLDSKGRVPNPCIIQIFLVR